MEWRLSDFLLYVDLVLFGGEKGEVRRENCEGGR
jgi:hypothetical protein